MKLQSSIHAVFSELAERIPERNALVCGERRVSYRWLDHRSDEIAGYLRAQGVARGSRVGLYAQRSIEAVAAMLGILKAGAAYVPFDPAYPPKLLSFVYEDCAPALMLVQPSLLVPGSAPFWRGTPHDIREAAGMAADDAAGATAGPADEAAREALSAGATATTPLPLIGQDDPAYVMYTSGSTGHPKGVVIPHRGVLRLVIDNPFAAMGPEEVHLQLAPLAFDASTFEIWSALLNGGQLAILSAPYPSLDDIAAAIADNGVTTLWLTAGLFHLMVDHRLEGLAPLRQLIAGGDVLSPSHIAKAYAGLPSIQLINGYGPTENTTFTCCYRIPRDASPGPVPIGTPIAQTDVYVLDENRHPVGPGDPGELYAGGAGVALGYLNRDELTAERFVANVFDPSGRSTLYRTGDRVRRREDGNFEFLGRVDRQVKINGKRVELDEVEATLRRSPEVEDAAVTCPAIAGGARRIHAYIKFRNSDDKLNNINLLREFLKQESPDYMIPASFTPMDQLPLSPTGKVDRAQLPPPATAAVGQAQGAAPHRAGNEIESKLVKIWRNVLGLDAVNINDNFFDLGGTSLQLIQVHATIVSDMQRDVTLVELFQYPRISALAARLVPTPAAAPGRAGGTLTADERARRSLAALARARVPPRRSSR